MKATKFTVFFTLGIYLRKYVKLGRIITRAWNSETIPICHNHMKTENVLYELI